MSKRTKSADVRTILDTVLSHSLFHMYNLEKQIVELKLKNDGTDTPEQLKKANMYTLILTIMNDSIHSSHKYCEKMFGSKLMETYIKNQKLALDNKYVNPCECDDCRERGYVNKSKVAMEGNDNASKRDNVADASELTH